MVNDTICSRTVKSLCNVETKLFLSPDYNTFQTKQTRR